jgi:hypothetical protein
MYRTETRFLEKKYMDMGSALWDLEKRMELKPDFPLQFFSKATVEILCKQVRGRESERERERARESERERKIERESIFILNPEPDFPRAYAPARPL